MFSQSSPPLPILTTVIALVFATHATGHGPRATRALGALVFHPLLTPPFVAVIEGRGVAWGITGEVACSSHLLQSPKPAKSEVGDGRKKIEVEKPSGVDAAHVSLPQPAFPGI